MSSGRRARARMSAAGYGSKPERLRRYVGRALRGGRALQARAGDLSYGRVLLGAEPYEREDRVRRSMSGHVPLRGTPESGALGQ